MVKTSRGPQEAGEYRIVLTRRVRALKRPQRERSAWQISGRVHEQSSRLRSSNVSTQRGDRGARFRRAVHAADCAAHPRAGSLFRDSAVQHLACRNPQAGTRGHRAFRRAEFGVRPGRAGLRSAVSRWACRCSEFATACSGSRTRWAGNVQRAERREYGRRNWNCAMALRSSPGFPKHFKIWMSHGDHVLSTAARLSPHWRAPATRSAAVGRFRARVSSRAVSSGSEPHERGTEILRNFVFEHCGAKHNWNGASFIADTVEAIRGRWEGARASARSAEAWIRRWRRRWCIAPSATGSSMFSWITALLRKNEFRANDRVAASSAWA